MSHSGSQLQDIVLSWDYWQIERDNLAGQGVLKGELPKVPLQFSNFEEYVQVFEPLLLEECAAQLQRGQEEGTLSEAKEGIITQSDTRADGSLAAFVTLPVGISSKFAENDVFLLSVDAINPRPGSSQLHDKQRHALGIVEGHEGDQSLRVRFKLTDASQAGNESGRARARTMRTALTKTPCKWWLLRLSNLSTILREWAAVHSLGQMAMQNVLLTAKASDSFVASDKLEVPPNMEAAMRGTYNDSQMQAVTAGLDGSPVVLIQGPPGTGKTKTILGLLSIILHSGPKGAYSSSMPTGGLQSQRKGPMDFGSSLTADQRKALWKSSRLSGGAHYRSTVLPPSMADPSQTYGLLHQTLPRRIGNAEGTKARVLVCAPSNSALDEIVYRLISNGLFDHRGNIFTPNIVRVGVNIHHSVQSVALDTLVHHRLSQGRDSKAAPMSRVERDRLRMAILEEASIVCTTLAFSGSSNFTRLVRKFDVVVVDEAAQAVEPSVLVPLAHGGAKQVFLVGDPEQLPATVISRTAVEQGYDKSLFKRLQQAGYPVNMLDTQYRMHPIIREYPSLNFYGGSLKDGPNVLADTERPWHSLPAFKPLVFYDVPSKETTPANSSSLVNHAEAEMVLSVYRELVHRCPELTMKPSVAIISPYKAQVALLQQLFKSGLGEELYKMVDINTIDGFQGREKEVAIFSTVRSQQGKTIGFVADEQRINVGLTRARCSLLIVGNAATLKHNFKWSGLISHIRKQHCMFRASKPYHLFPGKVADGAVAPEEPTAADLEEFVPQAEPRVLDEDSDLYSSDDAGPPAKKVTTRRR